MRNEVTWIQHPVGHGGFHTGVATSENCRDLRWIYDVGSTSLKTLRTELKAWIGSKRVVVDWLFISHFDNDHVNGLEDLFKHAHVRSVLLPYVNDEAFAHALCEATLDRAAAWMLPLLADPVAWFAARDVEAIYVFEGGDGGGGPDAESGPDGRPPEGSRGEAEKRAWKEVITPTPRLIGDFNSDHPGSEVYAIPAGRCRIALGDGLSRIRFEPYKVAVDPWEQAFLIARLCEITGEVSSGADLRPRLARAVARKAGSSRGRKDIKTAYQLAIGGSNRSSLSMLSVLDAHPSAAIDSVVHRAGMCVAAHNGAVAWGSTGDAELLWRSDYWGWFNRYQFDLHKLMVLATPHHGSDANSDAAFQDLNRRALLTAHVRKGASKHPGQAVSTVAGKRLALVTNEKGSAVSLRSLVIV